MRFLQLAVQNLGVFRDYHYFDLEPRREPEGQRRPLTVISGPNGVGKSTLFQALLLALYGQQAAGDRLSRQAYSDFLVGRLHRSHIDGEPTPCDQASVALTVQYVESGTQFRLDIERLWERKGATVVESLRLRRDGEQCDLGTSDYQAFINDLIPPGLGAVCFFDAEQMDALSNPESMDVALADTLHRLFGIDVVDRLIADLDRFTSTRGGGKRAKTRLKAEQARIRPQIEVLETQLLKARAELESLSARQRETERQLADRVRRLAEVEGKNTTSRPVLEAKRSSLQKDIEGISEQLRDMCGELFPFALAPALCERLSRRLDEEAEQRRYQAADALWVERVGRVEALLASPKLWSDIRLSAANRETVIKRLLKQLGAVKKHKGTDATFVHPMSDPERERLQGWISQVLNLVPEQVRTLGEQLQQLKSEESDIEIKVQQLPPEDVISQANEEIAALETLVSEMRQKQTELAAQIGVLQYKRDEAQRQLDGTGEQLRKHREADLAGRSKNALRAYKDAVTHQKTATLEQALVAAFNRLCRKEYLLGSVRIDPSNFNIELCGPGGVSMALSSFSAGERHLFALALLWALRQAGGRQLPLVIDTPLARLDDVHRHRLIDDYVSNVSDQVLFFATDAELDEGLLTDAQTHLARVYRLNYDEQAEETVVIKRDFTSKKSSLVKLGRRS